jgi:hypothetical protein
MTNLTTCPRCEQPRYENAECAHCQPYIGRHRTERGKDIDAERCRCGKPIYELSPGCTWHEARAEHVLAHDGMYTAKDQAHVRALQELYEVTSRPCTGCARVITQASCDLLDMTAQRDAAIDDVERLQVQLDHLQADLPDINEQLNTPQEAVAFTCRLLAATDAPTKPTPDLEVTPDAPRPVGVVITHGEPTVGSKFVYIPLPQSDAP